MDAGLFHSGVYLRYLDPNSTTGSLENTLRWERSRPLSRPAILVIGDSRVAEGFSARDAASAPVTFHSAAIPGSSPRVWYYLLRDIDPTAKRYQALAIGLPTYEDEDDFEDPNARVFDLRYLINRLRLTDLPDFAASFPTARLRFDMLVQGTFKGLVLKDDVQAFLQHRRKRLQETAANRKAGSVYVDTYGGNPDSLVGLSIDWEARKASKPGGLNQNQINTLNDTIFRPALPQQNWVSSYRKRWLGRIVDRYAAAGTPVIFFALPRGPVAPRREPEGTEAFRRQAKKRATFLPPSLFVDLERPEFFFDGVHLNREGRRLFSPRLGTALAAQLPHAF